MMRVLVLPTMCMHGAFAAGVLAGLEEKGLAADYFTAMVGASSGAWNEVYSATGQLLKEGFRLWSDHLPNGFLRWRWGKPYADLAYLEHLARDREALDIRKLRKAKTDCFAVVTDMDTRTALYAHLNSETDPIPYLIAGSAIPILSKPQKINGIYYGDGALTDSIPIRFAESLGADEIWIILNTPKGYRNSRIQWKIISWFGQSAAERELLVASRDRENELLREIEERSDLIVLRPSSPLPVSRFSRDKQEMRQLFASGKKMILNKM